MHALHPHKTGLALGGLLGLLHAIWSVLVALGLAGPLIAWVYGVHMIRMDAAVLPFSLTSAVLLVIVTAAVGYLVGRLFAIIWNIVQK